MRAHPNRQLSADYASKLQLMAGNVYSSQLRRLPQLIQFVKRTTSRKIMIDNHIDAPEPDYCYMILMHSLDVSLCNSKISRSEDPVNV